MQETAQKEGKERLRLFEILSILVAVLVAGTTLWNYREKLPDWWFQTTLGVLLFIVVILVFNTASPFLSVRFKQWKEKRRRNEIARKYFPELKNLVKESNIHNYSIRSIMNTLHQHYKNNVKSLLSEYVLQSHNEMEIQNLLYNINKEMEESNKTFGDLFLITKHFELALIGFKRNLGIIETFAHEVMIADKEIAKGIEDNFEDFREKYNHFLNNFKDYCQRVNREIGEDKLPERTFDIIKKW